MSRSIVMKQSVPPGNQLAPGVAPGKIEMFRTCEGMNTLAALETLAPTKAYDILGMRIDMSGKLIVAEKQSAVIPLLNNETLVTSFYFTNNFGIDLILAATTVGLQLRTLSGSWIKLTGPAFTDVNVGDHFSFAMWGQKVLVTNAVVGLHEIDIELKTYEAILDSNYPVAPMFVQVFDGRVIATRLTHRPGVMQWSVQGDSRKWDPDLPNGEGLGSGEEDLAAGTSSIAGAVHNLWPLSETTAMLIRDRGITIVSTTDNFDAPFRFDRFLDGTGTRTPHSFVSLPDSQGIIGVDRNNVVLINQSGVTPLGDDIINSIFDQQDEFTDIDDLIGAWHNRLREYWLLLPSHPTWGQTILRCKVDKRAWYRYPLSTPTTSLCYYEGPLQLDYGATVGDYASKSSVSIHDIGREKKGWGMLGASGGMTKIGLDLSSSSATSKAWRATTGEINGDTPEADVTITEVTVEYDIGTSPQITVDCEYSIDEGETWLSYSSFIVAPSTATNTRLKRIATMTRAITAHAVMFRIGATEGIPAFRLLCVTIRGSMGARRFQK